MGTEGEDMMLESIFYENGITTDTVVNYINAYRAIAFKKEYQGERVDKIIWDGAIQTLNRHGIVSEQVPEFVPYVKLDKPSKENIDEYVENNNKMYSRLAKEDKTKRVNVEKNEVQAHKKRILDADN